MMTYIGVEESESEREMGQGCVFVFLYFTDRMYHTWRIMMKVQNLMKPSRTGCALSGSSEKGKKITFLSTYLAVHIAVPGASQGEAERSEWRWD